MQAMRPGPDVISESSHLDYTMANLVAAIEVIVTSPLLPKESQTNSPIPSNGDPLGVEDTKSRSPQMSDRHRVSVSHGNLRNLLSKSRSKSPQRERIQNRRLSLDHGVSSTFQLLGRQNTTSSQHGMILKQGALRKKGWLSPVFRARYFYLHLPSPHSPSYHPYLRYFLSKAHTEQRGIIELTEGSVGLVNGSRTTFLLKLQNSSFVLRAPTDLVAASWIRALRPMVTPTVQSAFKALRGRIQSFELTLQEYERVIESFAKISVKDTQTGDGNVLLNRLSVATKRHEAKELEQWAMEMANNSHSPGEKVTCLKEIAAVLGEHLAEGKITQEDYDKIVRKATEYTFSNVQKIKE
ncbi:hypothetical protein AAMO2058_001227500 [Amorphochlora amoebiformis]